ncbi:MAG: diguanylate cyclase [Nitrospirales bacterium]|nr:diguanylate cyclase [Nitrospirales bacterium]
MKSRTSSIKQFFIIFLPSLVIITIILGRIFMGHLETETRLVSNQEADVIRLHERTILAVFDSIFTDLFFLSEEEALKDLLDKNTPLAGGRVAREWQLFAQKKRIYKEISYIDRSGMEMVKISLSQGKAFAAPPRSLEDRQNSPEFGASVSLAPGEAYVSPFGQTIGKEIPDSPVLTFATPVFNRKGRRMGVLSLTYRGTDIISKIAEESLHSGREMLVSPDGSLLYSSNPLYTVPFPQSFPDVWRRIAATDKGQINDDRGLFAFSTVYPVKESQGSGVAGHKDYYWKIISFVPATAVNRLRLDVLSRYVMIYAVILGLLAIGSRVISREWLKEKEMAETDPLTGISNRRRFFAVMEKELERSVRYGRQISLIMLDIDHFKKINDRFGHNTGDRVLQSLVTIITGNIRTADLLGRYGGEEFILLCPETDRAGASGLAERLRAAVAEKELEGAGQVTISLGVAELRRRESGDDFLKRVDHALYAAKESGRNRVMMVDSIDYKLLKEME